MCDDCQLYAAAVAQVTIHEYSNAAVSVAAVRATPTASHKPSKTSKQRQSGQRSAAVRETSGRFVIGFRRRAGDSGFKGHTIALVSRHPPCLGGAGMLRFIQGMAAVGCAALLSEQLVQVNDSVPSTGCASSGGSDTASICFIPKALEMRCKRRALTLLMDMPAVEHT